MILIKSLEKQIVPGNVIEVDTFGDPADMDIRQPMVKKQVVRARLFRDRWGRDVSIGCTKEVLADLQIIFDTIDDQAQVYRRSKQRAQSAAICKCRKNNQ
jgi:hypothetical protein